MSDSTVDTLTITKRIQFEGSERLIFSNNPLTIASPQLLLDSPVRISNGFDLSGPMQLEGTVKLEGALDVQGGVHIRSREGEATPGLESFNGAVLNGIGIGAGLGHGVTIDVPAQPSPHETIGTVSKAHNLRLYSYNNIYFHTKDPSAIKMSLDQNGNLAVKGTLQVGKNITFDSGLTVDTTYKSTVDASNDGYGGTPTKPGPRNPITILNNLNNPNSLVIEIDSSNSNAGNLVLWWTSNGKKYKTSLAGTLI